jgi:hypothetical protein
MPRMPEQITIPAPDGVSLEDALQRWGDPAAVPEMLRFMAQGYNAPITVIGGPETEFDRKRNQYRRVRARLEADLVEKLRRGTLTCVGFDPRSPLDRGAVTIAPDLWQVLEPDFDKSEAKLDDLVVATGIRVFEGPPPRPAQTDRTAGKFIPVQLTEWYQSWVKCNRARGIIPDRGGTGKLPSGRSAPTCHGMRSVPCGGS